MTTEQRDKYAYELMVKNNPDETVKQLLLKDKIIDDKLKEIEVSIANDLAATNARIDKAIEYIGNGNIGIPKKTREKFIKILKGEENGN